MRADRLLALLMVLRRRDRVTAGELAAELEVSERTILRDIDALSASGVPVYAERGRSGGFSLLPGWTTDLSGLSGDEARALLIAGASTADSLGIGSAFASGLSKVLSSLPEANRRDAGDQAARILVVDEGYLGRRFRPSAQLAVLQRAVTAGRRIEFDYRTRTGETSRRTVDPAGLVCGAGVWYLLAIHRSARRMYRVDRIDAAVILTDPLREVVAAQDLPDWWTSSREQFLRTLEPLSVTVSVGDDAALLAAIADRAGGFADDGVPHRAEEGMTATIFFAGTEQAMALLWPHLHQVRIESPDDLVLLAADRLAAATQRQA